MNAFAGIRPNFPRRVKTRPPQLFSLAFAVGVICFPVGVQPPQPPANFYPDADLKLNVEIDRISRVYLKITAVMHKIMFNEMGKLHECHFHHQRCAKGTTAILYVHLSVYTSVTFLCIVCKRLNLSLNGFYYINFIVFLAHRLENSVKVALLRQQLYSTCYQLSPRLWLRPMWLHGCHHRLY